MSNLVLTGELQTISKDSIQFQNSELDQAKRLDKEMGSKDMVPKTKQEIISNTKSAEDRIFVYKQRKWLV